MKPIEKLKNAQLTTVWGDAVDPGAVLAEYPRPQMVRDSYLNLNGYWDYAIRDTSREPVEYDGKILVPFSPEAALSGVHKRVEPTDFLFYRRTFTLPEGFCKEKVFLHFGAVDQIAWVSLNGKRLVRHTGGYLPFTVDVTHFLKKGENELRLMVEDVTDSSYHTRGKQCGKPGGIWYSPQSGIWQTVWLESVPESYLLKYRATPLFDEEKVQVRLAAKGPDTSYCVEVYDGETLVCKEETDRDEVTLSIPGCKPWSPESPFLYGLVIRGAEDTVRGYFGMRKVSVGTDENGVPRLMLNNRPYFHNGVLDQGYWPDGLLTPPSDEAMQFDIKTMKDMGFNMLRKHIKVEPLRWYYHCDRLGMLVWQDMVNGGELVNTNFSGALAFVSLRVSDAHYRHFGRENAQGRRQFVRETRATMDLLYNVPSIAVWVPFNEGWGQFDSAQITSLMRKWDPTRPIDHASGWHDQGAGDFKSHHIYFKPIRLKPERRVVALTEFGGYSCPVEGHMYSDKMFGYQMYKDTNRLEDAYCRLYEKVILPQIKTGLSATVYTQVTDVEDELNGLMTYDRRVIKMDVARVRRLNRRCRLPCCEDNLE